MEVFQGHKTIYTDRGELFTPEYVSYLERQIVVLSNKLVTSESQVRLLTSQNDKRFDNIKRSYDFEDDHIGYPDDDHDR